MRLEDLDKMKDPLTWAECEAFVEAGARESLGKSN
jgi:hypothetical protein